MSCRHILKDVLGTGILFLCLCCCLQYDSLTQNMQYCNVYNYTLIRIIFRVSLMQSELVEAASMEIY
jgi:hypothetical protein